MEWVLTDVAAMYYWTGKDLFRERRTRTTGTETGAWFWQRQESRNRSHATTGQGNTSAGDAGTAAKQSRRSSKNLNEEAAWAMPKSSEWRA